MKKLLLLFVVFFGLFLTSIYAAIADTHPTADKPGVATTKPSWWHAKPTPNDFMLGKKVVLQPGSLRANIERIAYANGWLKIVWNVDKDYSWANLAEVKGADFQDIMRRILKKYPLQATFYTGSHVLVIQPKTVQ